MKSLNKYSLIVALVTMLIGLALGWLIFDSSAESPQVENDSSETETSIWTCSMHPQIRQNEPGDCPLCGMDLIPLANNDSGEENPLVIKMSEMAIKLANIRTSVIEKRKPIKKIRMNGKITADERQVSSLSSHIPGRVEKLMVGFTGEKVHKGQVLAYVYSPELITAQEELLEANKLKNDQPGLFQAAKEKLKNWKLTENQIEKILKNGGVQSEFPILSDLSGTVLNKQINVGDYIGKGQPIFQIANLNKVWVMFELYENDIPWVHVGDDVSFEVQSFPGEEFQGKIEFIDPSINPKTRVVSARVGVDNRQNRLKPEMFVTGSLEAPLKNEDFALVVPKSAVMWTGERSVVYVKVELSKGIGFELREVVLGPALGDSYLINSGLSEGEEIATNGTFSIDAAAQLAGKPSMMNQKPLSSKNENESNGEHVPKLSVNPSIKAELNPLIEVYFLLKDALVKDQYESGLKASKQALKVLNKVDMGVFKDDLHEVWMDHQSSLTKALTQATKSEDIDVLRVSFKSISDQMIKIVKQFGPFENPIYVDYCPMAIQDQGADWMSLQKEIRNPYFGASMLKCGEIKQVINK